MHKSIREQVPVIRSYTHILIQQLQ